MTKTKEIKAFIQEFFKVVEDSKESEDSELYYCALYNLSVTYYSQNETAASMERFKMIYDDAPEEIKFDSFYNMGVISHQSGNYEKACDYFKKALEIKSENTDAKINYEISMLKLQNTDERGIEVNEETEGILIGDAKAAFEKSMKVCNFKPYFQKRKDSVSFYVADKENREMHCEIVNVNGHGPYLEV